jgi:hypothetical protein
MVSPSSAGTLYGTGTATTGRSQRLSFASRTISIDWLHHSCAGERIEQLLAGPKPIPNTRCVPRGRVSMLGSSGALWRSSAATVWLTVSSIAASLFCIDPLAISDSDTIPVPVPSTRALSVRVALLLAQKPMPVQRLARCCTLYRYTCR